MKENTLYIIGNGFDLYHCIKSNYSDFRDFLAYSELLNKLEEYFGCDSLWSNFESTLAFLDTEQIFDECLTYLESYGCDEWSDSYHSDFQFEIEQRIELITEGLRVQFLDWILQLEIPTNFHGNLIKINRDAIFVSFNYTDTLERLYKISSQDILYIHNKACDQNSKLIIGHGRNISQNELFGLKDKDTDPRIVEGNELLDAYFNKTYKSTKNIIANNHTFFDQLSKIKIIYVLGHSLSDIDLPYFQEIVKNIDLNTVKWRVSYHEIKDLQNHRQKLLELGIDSNLIDFSTLASFE